MTFIYRYLKMNILRSDEKYLGRTYGEWGAEWWNWLCSEDPDNTSGSDPIVFLRANLDYAGEGDARRQTGRHFEHKLNIPKNSIAVFFPVIEAQFYIGHPYYYEPPYPVDKKERNKLIETDEEISDLLDKDLQDVTHLKAVINDIELTPVRARSPTFTFKVSEKNELRNKMQQGIIPAGEYHAITEGYWILAILPTGNYKVHFEGARKELFYSATYNILIGEN
jgi:hypothetical protein